MSDFPPPTTPAGPTAFRPPQPTATTPDDRQAGSEAPGRLIVHISGPLQISFLGVPRLMIDGNAVGSQYGINIVDLPAGMHRVQLYAQYLWRYGHALLDVYVPPNQTVEVLYREPWTHWARSGTIGLRSWRPSMGDGFRT